jgi:hypothetical protein
MNLLEDRYFREILKIFRDLPVGKQALIARQRQSLIVPMTMSYGNLPKPSIVSKVTQT